jgi:hypothetical protein
MYYELGDLKKNIFDCLLLVIKKIIAFLKLIISGFLLYFG